jgi:two-component system OmpR family sensor kinase
MPSANEPQRRGRLSSRVLAASAASAALSAAVALLVGITAIDRLVVSRSDERLRGATNILAGELLENRAEADAESMVETVTDENSELVTSGIRLAIFENGRVVAGDAWIPMVAADSCETHDTGPDSSRVCGRSFDGRILVAADRLDEAMLNWIYLGSASVALFIAAILAALSSLSLTRWSLQPLERLSTALRSMRPDGPLSLELQTPLETEEVEAIRAALWGLLRRSQALLTQAQTFAANAAHELRTPLTTICAELELLVEEPLEQHEQAALLRLRDRTLRLAGLVERLLVLATPLGAKLQGEAVAMGDVVQEVLAELGPESKHRLTVEVVGEGLVRGELTLLRSMVGNAIDNALKFSAPKPVVVRLTEGETVALEVIDSGPGVPESERSRVFEPFYRGLPSSAGHGLGLALIAHIAHAHAGDARFLAQDQGARLLIELPRWSPLADPG